MSFISTDVIFFDNVNGAPAALGKIYFGEPNTNPKTPANQKAPYTDRALLVPTAAEQDLTTAGKLPDRLYLDGAYSVTVDDADGVQIFADPYVVALGSGSGSGGGGTVDSVVAGSNVTVNSSDPANPVVSAYMIALTSELLTGNKTLVASDSGKYFYTARGGSTSSTITVPSGLPAGFFCTVKNKGTGTVQYQASGVQINLPAGGTAITETEGGYASILHDGSEEYSLFGQVTSA